MESTVAGARSEALQSQPQWKSRQAVGSRSRADVHWQLNSGPPGINEQISTNVAVVISTIAVASVYPDYYVNNGGTSIDIVIMATSISMTSTIIKTIHDYHDYSC